MWGAQRRRVWSNNVTSLYSSMEKTCTFSASSMALSEDIRVQDRHFPSIFEAKVLCDRFLIRWKLSEVFLEVLFSPSIREAIINMSCFSPPRKCERPQFGRHLNWREAPWKNADSLRESGQNFLQTKRLSKIWTHPTKYDHMTQIQSKI